MYRNAIHRAGLAAVVVALFAGACSGGGSGGPGVASAGTGKGTSSTSAAGGSGKAGPLAYSQCMRSHGLRNFPDPNANGGLTLNNSSGLDPNSPQFKSADAACKPLQPQLPQAQRDKMKAGALKYAQCMRSHGVTDFPDPGADGGIQIQATPGSDLAPDSPLFKAADKICQKLMPAPPGGERNNLQSNGGAGS